MLSLLLVSALAILSYWYSRLRHKRLRQYAAFPQLQPSLLWGHLQVFDSFTRKGHSDRHPDLVFSDMQKAIGQPPLLFVDLRPVQYPMVVVFSYEVAEQITKASKLFPRSTPKSPTIGTLVHLTGSDSMIALQGEDWWAKRKMFNPGFAPTHLLTLLPRILDKTSAFMRHLDHLAVTREEFSAVRLTTNLTFDIIGAVVMDEDFQAQEGHPGQMIRLYSALLDAHTNDAVDWPWWLAPTTHWRRYRLGKAITDLMRSLVRKKFAEQQALGDSPSKARSVLSLSLQDVTTLTPSILDEICDQLKSFLFAGHDTTSVMLSWAFYELSRTPRALKAVRAELDSIFGAGSSPDAVRNMLLSQRGPDCLRRMVYAAAVVKEVLRLHPPASTARMAPPGSGFTVQTPTGDLCLDGMIIYVVHSMIQRDRAVYGPTADDFVPERWLDSPGPGEKSADTDVYAQKLPVGAWRPVSP